MKKYIVVCILIISICFTLEAAEKQNYDSVKIRKTLSDLSYQELETKGVALFLEKKYDKANLFFEEMLKRQNRKKNPSPQELGLIYYCSGRVAQEKNKLDKAIILFEKAALFYRSQPIHDKIEADLYFYMAIVYYHNKNNKKALNHSKTALSLAKMAYGSNATFTASCMVSYAIILHNMKQQNKAIEVLKKAHKILSFSKKGKKAAQRVAKLLKKWTS